MIYENLTDKELIREAEGQSGLVRALSERLDMRQQDATTIFHEQAFFMRACGQTTTTDNVEQSSMYLNLIDEEVEELAEAIEACDDVEIFDAILDILVVCIGYGLSRGWPMVEGWDEVMRSNLAKIDPVTGVVRRREDGKILKPTGWAAPALAPILNRSNQLI